MNNATDLEQLLLVVHHFRTSESGNSIIFTQKDCLLGANFLTHPAENAANHVNIELTRILFDLAEAIFGKVEKYPREFDIDMIRCIFCWMCEEVCPEQAIFLRKDYAITGLTRAEMVHNKEKLLEIGGVIHGVVLKWNEKK